jgi:hypothetical protein
VDPRIRPSSFRYEQPAGIPLHTVTTTGLRFAREDVIVPPGYLPVMPTASVAVLVDHVALVDPTSDPPIERTVGITAAWPG